MTTLTITSSDTWTTPRRQKRRSRDGHHKPQAPPSQQLSSTSLLSSFPPLSTLQIWVQRPQAIAKCTLSDLYGLQALVPAFVDHNAYMARDVFLLDRYPCRMVEIVGWVAGVDHKETSMTVIVDDGDGKHIMPVTVKHPLRTQVLHPPVIKRTSTEVSTTFTSTRERKAQRKAAVAAVQPDTCSKPVKVYMREDIRVGDTVRIVGRVDEWARKKATGDLEWVRQLVIDEGSGGSIRVVDEDEQFHHNAHVLRLHETLYSQPFSILPVLATSSGALQPPSPVKSFLGFKSMDPSSELSSVADMEVDPHHIKLRDPSKLSSSQLTDSTFRQYLLDFITQETISSLQHAGPFAHTALGQLFPEYFEAVHGKAKGKSRAAEPFGQSTKDNHAAGPSYTFRSRKLRSTTPLASHHIDPFTVSSILDVPHLNLLARLVVDNEARKEERRRRKRIRDGVPRPRDLEVEVDRKRRGLEGKEWRLTEDERYSKMGKLVAWVIRGVAEEGGVVQLLLPPLSKSESGPIKKNGNADTERFGYLPIPPPLLLPLLLPMIKAEEALRSGTILRRGDPRRGNGMVIEQIVGKLRGWGVEGRWERVQDWAVQDALQWGVVRGYLRVEGRGWWVTADWASTVA